MIISTALEDRSGSDNFEQFRRKNLWPPPNIWQCEPWANLMRFPPAMLVCYEAWDCRILRN